VIVFFFAACLWGGVPAARGAEVPAIDQGFAHPPDSARPHTWWHWMNGNVSADGITRDLEGMKRFGLGGFEVFDVTDRIPRGPVNYMSDQWLEMMKHAASEADRLGLEMCMHNCAGWSSSGGPWNKPNQSMQEVIWSETHAAGGKKIELNLPQPEARQSYYGDIAVIAFPTLKGDSHGRKGFRLSEWTWKIDRNTKGRKPDSQITRDTRTPDAGDVIKPESVQILSDHMSADGRLSWDAPAGDWTIMRFGYTTTGRTNRPAPDEGLGLECNKLDAAAVKFQWDHSVQRVIDRLGPLAPKVFKDVLIDSWEVGFQNWTPGLEKTFKERLGYDPLPYFPCLSGRVIGSVDTSERFLWDFRRLIADLMAQNYFGTFKKLCNERGMKLSIEPYGPSGFDYFQVAGIADIPMGEFWVDRADAWHLWSCKLASSAAHANGYAFGGAETFTAKAPASGWRSDPYSLKTLGDHFYAQGLNRMIFHTCVHEPWADDVLPGMTMGPHGTQMNRHNTWYSHARPWIDHLARSQYLLQQGQFVADLCYLASEDAPQTPLNREDLKPLPPAGYDYDMLQYGFIMQMSVKDHRLVLPSGMSYRVLVLPDTNRLRPELLAKIAELASDGATIYAPKKITASPSLTGQPQADQKVQKLAGELWSSGKVISGKSLAEVLSGLGLDRDFEASQADLDYAHRRAGSSEIYFVSNQQDKPAGFQAMFRAAGQPELWHPETGRIESVEVYQPMPNQRTRIGLHLGPAQSVFVVFRHPPEGDPILSATRGDAPLYLTDGSTPVSRIVASESKPMLRAWQSGQFTFKRASGAFNVDVDSLPEPMPIAGGWKLAFPPGWGAPASIDVRKLASWTDMENSEIKHFSGTATYTIHFDVPAEQIGKGKLAMLDLGDVQVMAEVKLNGKDLGLLWKPPFRADVSDLLRAGDNELQVSVTNLWVNRLIGDEQYPLIEPHKLDNDGHGGVIEIPRWLTGQGEKPQTKRKTFSTWRHYTKDDALLPSGLIGPVRIFWGKELPMAQN
jgi:hypothetical protein